MTCPCCGYNPDAKGLDLIGQQLKLTPQERTVFNCLSRNFEGEVPTDRFFEALWSSDPDGGPMTAKNVLSVVTGKLRKKLEPHGLTIESRGGPGSYRRLCRLKSEPAAAQ